MAKYNIAKKIFLFPCAVIFTILSFIVVPIFYLSIIIPFFLYKQLIILCAKYVHPGARILSGLDNIISQGNIYSQRDVFVCVQLVFSGNLLFEEFVKEWDVSIMKKLRENGSLKFPELQSYIQTWKGYSFYIFDKYFDLGNHIKHYEDPEGPNSFVDRRKLDEIRIEFMKPLFPEKRSPWELLVVNNYRLFDKEDEESYSVIIFKYHHSLADGYATLLLFWEALGGQKLEKLHKPKKVSRRNNVCQIIWLIITSFIDFCLLVGKIPFNLIYDRDRLQDKNSWHNCKDFSNTLFCTLRPIETSRVKEIGRQNDVSVTSVLHAVCVGAFRKMMDSKGLIAPKSIRACFALPLPNHPDKLKTHSSLTYFDIPIEGDSDRKKMEIIENRFIRSIKASLFAGTPLLKIPILSNVPASFNDKLLKGPNFISMITSTVPLPLPSESAGVEFHGCRVIQTYFTIEVAFMNIPVAVFILKYKQYFFISFGIQRHLLNDDSDIYEIEKYVLQELNRLKDNSSIV